MTLQQIKEARENRINYHENNVNDCGGRGRAFELRCAREKSHKTTVAEQNQKDVSIKVFDGSKIRYIEAECKTNGGRIEGFYNGSIKAKFVIYRLEYTQKLKFENDVRVIPPVIIPTDLFLNMLTEVKAIKAINRNGELDGYGIQVSSKKMYLRLNDYVNRYGDMVLFNNEKTFVLADFESITL